MKKLLPFLLLFPSLLFAVSAGDLKIAQRNSTNTAWVDVIFTTGVSSYIGTNSSGVPIIKAGGGGGSAWGDITGTLSDQTDLYSALAGKSPLASPAFTGNPTAPTQSAGNNSTRLATTAYVDTADALKANIASPTFTGTPAAPTATAGTNTTQLATTAFVQTAVTGGGGGNVSNTGTPANGQAAEWTGANNIQGVAVTGSGNYVKATSPTLVAPILGTPASVTLTNATGLPQAGTVGLTTSDSPQFAGVNVGASSDTTITRVSAGVVAVEGNTLLRTSGALTTGNLLQSDGSGRAVDSGAVALNGVTSSAGAADSGKVPLLNGSGLLDTSFLATTTVSKGGTGQTSYTDGQLLIGNTSGNTLTKSTLTAGSNITITNGNGSITIAASGGGGSGDRISTLVNSEVSITGTATATISKQHVCSGTTSDYTVTLPAVSGNAGKYISFRMASGLTKLVTIDGNGSETIDGSLTRIMWANETAELYCDGTTWTKMAGKSIPTSVTATRPGANQSISANTSTEIIMAASSPTIASMWDSGNGRVKVIRPGEYICTAFLYATGLMTYTYSGFSVNGSPTSAIQQTLPIFGAAAGIVSEHITAAAANDYIQPRIQGDATMAVYGTGAAASINIVEIPTW